MAEIPAARTSLAECEMPATFEAVESRAIPAGSTTDSMAEQSLS